MEKPGGPLDELTGRKAPRASGTSDRDRHGLGAFRTPGRHYRGGPQAAFLQ